MIKMMLFDPVLERFALSICVFGDQKMTPTKKRLPDLKILNFFLLNIRRNLDLVW